MRDPATIIAAAIVALIGIGWAVLIWQIAKIDRKKK